MYTLLQERRRLKDLLLQFLLLGLAFFITEKFVDYLVEEKQLFPESFTLESAIFLTNWFVLDLVVCSILRYQSCLQSLFSQGIAKISLPSLAVAWVVAEVFFKFHSFALELLSMLGLWFLLDFAANRLIRKSRSH